MVNPHAAVRHAVDEIVQRAQRFHAARAPRVQLFRQRRQPRRAVPHSVPADDGSGQSRHPSRAAPGRQLQFGDALGEHIHLPPQVPQLIQRRRLFLQRHSRHLRLNRLRLIQ